MRQSARVSEAKRWRKKAEKVRAVGELMNDPMARSAMFAVAEGYERLADRAETAGTMVDIDSFLLPPD